DVVLADINSTHLFVEAVCGRRQTGREAYTLSYYEPRLEWNHIVFKRNASGGYIYINGKYSWDPTGGNSLSECANAIASAPGTDMIIGYGPTYYEGYFNGSIDEVAIFNRSLTDDEIKAIYSSTQYFTVDITPPTTTPPPTTPPSEVEIQRDELVYTTPSGAKFYRATGSDGLTQPLAVDGVLPVSDDPIYTMAAGDFDGK
ncbi:MAG: LamG-like jellyroll fold domain-containing protein, partial [Candidatus Hydrothermarchaeales archaeon]